MSTTTRPYPLNQGVWGTLYANAGSKPFTVALLSGYTYSAAHQYADDLTGELSGGGYARVTITNPTYTTTDGVTTLAGDDPVFASFTGTYDTVVILADEGADSVSRLMSCISTTPTTITADTLTIDLPAGVIGTYDNATPDLTSVAGVGPDSSGDVPAGSLATALGFVSPGATALGDLSDVNTTGAAEGDVVTSVGGVWVPATPGSGITSVFAYNPDDTQTGNRYNDWADLMTAVAAVAGPKTIDLASSSTDPDFPERQIVEIPAGGPYDLTDVTLTCDAGVYGLTLLVDSGVTIEFDGILTLANGVVLRGAPGLDAPIYEVPANSHRLIILDAGCLCNESTGGSASTLFGLPNNNSTLGFEIHHEGAIYNGPNVFGATEGAYEVIGSSGTGNSVLITTSAKSVVSDDIVRGAVDIFAYQCGSSSVHQATISNANLTIGTDYSIIVGGINRVNATLTTAADWPEYPGASDGDKHPAQDLVDFLAARAGGSGDLVSTNNLSDVASAATALANLGGTALAWSPLPTYVTTDQTWTTDTTLANVTGLTQAIGASETWLVDIWLSTSGGGTGDIRVTVTAPTSATSELIVTGVATGGSNAPTFAGIIAAPGTDTVACGLQASAGARNGVWIRGLVFNSTNAGSIAVQAAQNTSDGTATRVRKGSFMMARRLA